MNEENKETSTMENTNATQETTTQVEVNEKHTLKHLEDNNINVKSGLSILGDEATYNQMLKEFYSTIKDKFSKLVEAKASKDLASYASEAIDIKNSSNYLGFDDLHEYAKIHAYKASLDDFDYIADDFKTFEDELVRIITLVGEYFE